MADLQQKLAALNMGGLSVPLPPLNVQPIPLFKTPGDSGLLELNSLVQALPQVLVVSGQQVNQDAMLSVGKAIAGSAASS